MASTISDPQVARVALLSISRAILSLSRPTGTVTITNEFGSMTEDTYPIGRRTQDRFGLPPRLWPEVIAVTEALIGSAFVVAQAHLNATGKKSPTTEDIEHVANYWKHRDEWGPPWAAGPDAPRKPTLAAITRLGAKPPVATGQLEHLVAKVLGQPFDAEALWAAIA